MFWKIIIILQVSILTFGESSPLKYQEASKPKLRNLRQRYSEKYNGFKSHEDLDKSHEDLAFPPDFQEFYDTSIQLFKECLDYLEEFMEEDTEDQVYSRNENIRKTVRQESIGMTMPIPISCHYFLQIANNGIFTLVQKSLIKGIEKGKELDPNNWILNGIQPRKVARVTIISPQRHESEEIYPKSHRHHHPLVRTGKERELKGSKGRTKRRDHSRNKKRLNENSIPEPFDKELSGESRYGEEHANRFVISKSINSEEDSSEFLPENSYSPFDDSIFSNLRGFTEGEEEDDKKGEEGKQSEWEEEKRGSDRSSKPIKRRSGDYNSNFQTIPVEQTSGHKSPWSHLKTHQMRNEKGKNVNVYRRIGLDDTENKNLPTRESISQIKKEKQYSPSVDDNLGMRLLPEITTQSSLSATLQNKHASHFLSTTESVEFSRKSSENLSSDFNVNKNRSDSIEITENSSMKDNKSEVKNVEPRMMNIDTTTEDFSPENLFFIEDSTAIENFANTTDEDIRNQFLARNPGPEFTANETRTTSENVKARMLSINPLSKEENDTEILTAEEIVSSDARVTEDSLMLETTSKFPEKSTTPCDLDLEARFLHNEYSTKSTSDLTKEETSEFEENTTENKEEIESLDLKEIDSTGIFVAAEENIEPRMLSPENVEESVDSQIINSTSTEESDDPADLVTNQDSSKVHSAKNLKIVDGKVELRMFFTGNVTSKEEGIEPTFTSSSQATEKSEPTPMEVINDDIDNEERREDFSLQVETKTTGKPLDYLPPFRIFPEYLQEEEATTLTIQEEGIEDKVYEKTTTTEGTPEFRILKELMSTEIFGTSSESQNGHESLESFRAFEMNGVPPSNEGKAGSTRRRSTVTDSKTTEQFDQSNAKLSTQEPEKGFFSDDEKIPFTTEFLSETESVVNRMLRGEEELLVSFMDEKHEPLAETTETKYELTDGNSFEIISGTEPKTEFDQLELTTLSPTHSPFLTSEINTEIIEARILLNDDTISTKETTESSMLDESKMNKNSEAATFKSPSKNSAENAKEDETEVNPKLTLATIRPSKDAPLEKIENRILQVPITKQQENKINDQPNRNHPTWNTARNEQNAKEQKIKSNCHFKPEHFRNNQTERNQPNNYQKLSREFMGGRRIQNLLRFQEPKHKHHFRRELPHFLKTRRIHHRRLRRDVVEDPQEDGRKNEILNSLHVISDGETTGHKQNRNAMDATEAQEKKKH